MKESRSPAQLMCHWVTVVDAAGRPQLQAVWSTADAVVAHHAA